jgi:hypothetical protein
MKVTKIITDNSREWLFVKDRYLIPTIKFYKSKEEKTILITFCFMFWKWWYKVGLFIEN